MVVTITNLTSTTATVEWGQVAGAAQYEVLRALNYAGDLESTSYVFEPNRSQTYTDLTPGSNYWIKVIPLDGSNKDMTDFASIWTPFTTP